MSGAWPFEKAVEINHSDLLVLIPDPFVIFEKIRYRRWWRVS